MTQVFCLPVERAHFQYQVPRSVQLVKADLTAH